MAELVAKAVMKRVRAARKSGQEEHEGGASGQHEEVGRLAGGTGSGSEESTKAGKPEVEPRTEREDAAAGAYYDFLQKHQEYDEAAVRELVEHGDAVLEEAGSLEKAIVALRGIWWERHGYHLRGIFDKNLEPLVDGALLEYARKVAREGARTRFRGVPTRLKALPHPSAKDHLDEVMGALWKDAAKGRVLLCT